MVHTSSLIVAAAVAFGVISSVAAAPVSGQTTPAPVNGAAQGTPQSGMAQVDASITDQNKLLTDAKDKDAKADLSEAKRLEAEANALNNQADNMDPALRPKKAKSTKKDRKRTGNGVQGQGERPRTGTAMKPKQPAAAPGQPQNRRRGFTPNGTPAPAPVPVPNTQQRPAQVRPVTAQPQDAFASQQNAFAQDLTQQNNALNNMRKKYGMEDEQRAKELEREAAKYAKEAQTLDPGLDRRPSTQATVRTGATNGRPGVPAPVNNGKPAPGTPAPRLSRRGPGDDAASGAIAGQDKQLTEMKNTDAKKDAAEAQSLDAEAQQLTNQADNMDPSLKKKNNNGPKGGNAERRKKKKAKKMDLNGGAEKPMRKERKAAAEAQQVARYYYDDGDFYGRDFDEEELFGRELFDGEELYGREWYDLEMLD